MLHLHLPNTAGKMLSVWFLKVDCSSGSNQLKNRKHLFNYLTIIPRARMGYESIVHEAECRVGYGLRGYEGERNNCFSKIQLVGQKNIEAKHLSQVKARNHSFFTAKTLQIWGALFATNGL